ncbi:MAG TPA: hypothetical protein VGO13_03475 [Solirubrobacterales bacterium]|jgi:hypothetical protein|nr:hypothetical protein [Solirubrobacterales bacterium]
MADPNLTESAWQRAKVESAGVYRTTTFQLGGALLTAIFSSLALIAQEGQPTTTQVAVPILAAAVAILLSVVIVFVCQLAAAPIRQRDALRAAWEAPVIETVNIDLTLRNAHRKGNDLAKTLERKQGTTRTDRDAAEQWADEVVALMAGKVPDEATRDFLDAGKDELAPVRRLRLRVDALQSVINLLG